MGLAPPGWYPDPSGPPGQRYWDGSNWTEHRVAAPPPPPAPPAPDASKTMETLRQTLVDGYNEDYVKSLAEGHVFTTAELAVVISPGGRAAVPAP